MSGAGQQQVIAEFAELVANCRSSSEFWPVALQWLQAQIGFDAGYVATTLGSVLDAQGAVLEHDGEALRANIGRYLGEITAEEMAVYMNRARAHTDVWSQSRRARMQVFREVLDPTGARHVAVRISLRQNVLLGFNLERRSGRPFSDCELSLVDAVAPIIHLGDALTRALVGGDTLGEWAAEHELSRREKEIAELVVRGLKNAEIARLLNIAAFTVRNTLVRVFEKCGVNRRTELTFEALQGGGSAVRTSDRQSRDLLRVFYQRAGQSARPRPPAAPPWARGSSLVLARSR